MLDKKSVIKATFIVLGISLVLLPSQAFADRDRDRYRDNHRNHHRNHHEFRHHRHHSYPRHGLEIDIKGGLFSLTVGRSRYYYCDGVYYSRGRRGYVVVAPPPGAVIVKLPPYYDPVIVNGTTYYMNDDIYYMSTHRGYVVVPEPQSPVISSFQSNIETQTTDGAFTVNIPNNNGGYVPVVLKKLGNGFVGPQGEFYSEFPRVEQLRLMYGK